MNTLLKLQENSKKIQNLYKKLGYQSEKKFKKTFTSFLKTNSLKEWLNNDFYDFNHTQYTFLTSLIKIIKLNSNEENYFLKEINNYKIEKEYITPYIIITTDFKRTNESIFSMMFLSNKLFKINLDKNLLIKLNKKDEVFDYINKIVKNHYLENNGEIKHNHRSFGKILSYEYIHLDKSSKKISF